MPKLKTKDQQAEFQIDVATAIESVAVKSPFLKWAGRKTSIISFIKEVLPNEARCFVEPFVGSGAVFLNTDYPVNLLADSYQFSQTIGTMSQGVAFA